ncbi:hypothetical protein ABTY98_35435 [Streptomyces sp. NPDC096040]
MEKLARATGVVRRTQGYASGIGWGPKTRSNNDLRKGCGTSSPNP